MLKTFTALAVLAIFGLFSPRGAMATETRTLPPNHSFENWSFQDGIYLPSDWVVVQSNDPGGTINKSQHLFDGAFSMELKGMFPSQESTNSKATVIRSHLFHVNGYKTASKPLKLSVWIKPLNKLAEARGRLELLDYAGFPICGRKFAIPQTTTNWTEQVLICPTSSFKTGVVISQNSLQPAVYDKVSVIQLD